MDEINLPADGQRRFQPIRRSQWTLFSILVVATFGSVAMWLMGSRRELFLASGIYFVLVPGLLAALVSIIPFGRNQTRTGVVRATTIGILASAIILREGFICVLLALPLIIPIVALAAWMFGPPDDRAPRYVIPILFLGLSAEGVVYQPPTTIEVTRSRIMEAAPGEIQTVFGGPARLPSIEPLLLRLPFPTPTTVDGRATAIGDRLTVHFSPGGRLEMELVEQRSTAMVWAVVDDTTPLADWMALHRIEITWTGTASTTAVDVTIEFDRALAPAFYFDPLQRWGVGEMAEVMLDMVARNLDTDGAARIHDGPG